jgi:hypothetical protein
MLRSMFLIVALALVAAVNGELLVADNFGNSVSLPYSGGHISNQLTMDSAKGSSVSPYILQVFVNDGGHANEDESFYFESSTFGDATLISQTYSSTFAQGDAVEGSYIGSKLAPTTNTGLYTFTFDIPLTKKLSLDVMYFDHNPLAPLTDRIHIAIANQK